MSTPQTPVLRTALCDLVGVEHPIAQTGMGWVSGARLTSATANAGGLGFLAAATMDLDELRTAIRETSKRTERPFGVNLRADQPDAVARADLCVAEGVAVAGFAQAPRRELIERLKDGGVVVMSSVGARRHAEKVAEWGVDAVIVQGGEGGGHTGPVPTTVLLPQVTDAVDIPVVAAGGFFDGRGLVAALAYGASGIAMGTRFLLTSDNAIPSEVTDLYRARSVTDTTRTTQVDGVPHRVLRTDFTERLDRTGPLSALSRAVPNALAFKRLSGESWRDLLRTGLSMRKEQDLTWSQVVMAANTPMLLKAAMVDGRPDLGVMSSGQVVGLCDDLPSVDELISRIVAQATEVLERLGA